MRDTREGIQWVYCLWTRRDTAGEDGRPVGTDWFNGPWSRYDSRMLYVGVTGDFPARLKQHYKDKEWAVLIGEIELWAYPNRELAEAAEREAIESHEPLFNTMGTPLQWVSGNQKERITQQKARRELLDESERWVPTLEPKLKQQVLSLWKDSIKSTALGLEGLHQDLRRAFLKAAMTGVEYSIIEGAIQEIAGKAKQEMTPMVRREQE